MKPDAQNPEPSFTRSLRDLPVDQSGKIFAPDGASVSPTKNPERTFSSVLDHMRTTNPRLAREWDQDRRRRRKD